MPTRHHIPKLPRILVAHSTRGAAFAWLALGLLVSGASLLQVAPVLAFDREVRIEDLEVRRTDPALVHTQPGQWSLTRDDDRWERFTGERGDSWRVRWNEATRTPHRAFGGSVSAAALGGTAPLGTRDKQAVLALAEAFVRAESDLLGARWEDLRPVSAAFRGGRWCVTLQQTWRGIDVEGGRVDLRFAPNGNLLLFGSDIYPVRDAGTLPRLSAAAILQAAQSGLPVDANASAPSLDGELERVLLPMVAGEPAPLGSAKAAPRAVRPEDVRVRDAFRVRVRTLDPPGDWVNYVDAATGQVLWRYNRVRFIAASGTVTGDIHPGQGNDPIVTVPFGDEMLFGGVTTGTVASYNFESGTQGWTGLSPWARSTESVHGGTWAWSDSPGASYANNLNITLTSPIVNLSAVSDAVLEFWVRTDLENTWDFLYAEASADGGASWETLRVLTGTAAYHLESVDLAAVEGSSTVRVRFRLFSDVSVTGDGAWIDDVSIAVRGSAVTDASGAYTLTTTGGDNNVTTRLRGLYGDVYNLNGTTASQTQLATGGPVDFAWSGATSLQSERDMYYAIHAVHRRIQEIDPAFTALDYSIPVHVNEPDYCNAYWTGSTMVFGSGTGPSCADLGTYPSVMFHEYAHGITDFVYEPVSDPPGDMHEGFSDYLMASITNDPRVGPDIIGPGSMFRTIANNWRDPEDRGGEVHMDGTIVAAALWDMRTLLLPDVDLADSLYHFARYGFPYSFEDYFLEVLSVDDDNGNLGDGTPHLEAIRSAFGDHGIGYGPEIRHVQAAVQDAALGNGDGRLDPGETADVALTIRNFGGAETGVYAKISTQTPGVAITSDSVFVGNVGAGAQLTVSEVFTVSVDPGVAVGTAVVFDLELRSDVGFDGDVFMLPVGWVPILLADDDRGRTYEAWYQDSLARLGWGYTRWDVAMLGSPTAEEMSEYCAVIWFTGVDGVTTLAPGNQEELAAYLGAGGHLFVTGSNLAEDLWAGGAGVTPTAADIAFYENWLHATVNLATESGPPAVSGVAADPIGNGLAFTISGGDGANNQTSAASLFLRAGAASSLLYSNGRIAALRYSSGHRLFHCGFGFEAVSSVATRDSLMSRALGWLCPAEAVPPTVQVVEPNGGEVLTGTSPYTIRWTATDATAVLSVDILLSTDGGTNWSPIATGVPNSFEHEWIVDDVSSTQCRIRVQAADAWSNVGEDQSDMDFTIQLPVDVSSDRLPKRFALHPAVPNPFNPTTRLRFDLPHPSEVSIEVLTVDGRRVRTLVSGARFEAGTGEVVWDGRDDAGRVLAGGVYVVRFRTSDFTTARKVQLVK